MTQTVSRSYTILDHEFDIDELRDIAIFGMSQGVSGFIYTKDCTDKFDEYEDDIETYLCDWVYDNVSSETNYIQWIVENAKNAGHDVLSIDRLKNYMVWAFVELKADEILCSVNTDY